MARSSTDSRRRNTWLRWAVAGLVLGISLSVFDARDRLFVSTSEPPLLSTNIELVRHDGSAFEVADLSGGYSLVYFGYTHCPDVCPIGLFSLASVLKALNGSGRDVRPLFVTLDPERDTRDVMAAYVQAFHPDIVGLTGHEEHIGRLAGAMGVRYNKEGTGENYLVSHTAFTYLVSPQGEVLRSFPDGFDVNFAVGIIEQEVPVAPKG